MINITDDAIKEAGIKAAHRYIAQDSTARIQEVRIESKNDDEAIVCISWDYEGRESNNSPPDDMIFTVDFDGDDIFDVHGPEF